MFSTVGSDESTCSQPTIYRPQTIPPQYQGRPNAHRWRATLLANKEYIFPCINFQRISTSVTPYCTAQSSTCRRHLYDSDLLLYGSAQFVFYRNCIFTRCIVQDFSQTVIFPSTFTKKVLLKRKTGIRQESKRIEGGTINRYGRGVVLRFYKYFLAGVVEESEQRKK